MSRSTGDGSGEPAGPRRTGEFGPGEYAIPDGSKVFTCSWSDWFHKDADAWRPEAWEIVKQRPGVIFQIVTKRTERIAECLPADWGDGYPNVWLIATVENQKYADIRIPELLDVRAVVYGLSCEPLLGPIDLPHAFDIEERFDARTIDWVIAGGESGPDSRPTHPGWIRSLRDQCQAASVPFFFKQWGDWCPLHAFSSGPRTADEQVLDTQGRNLFGLTGLQDETCARMFRVGKKHAGRLVDGREWSEFPAGSRIPKAVP